MTEEIILPELFNAVGNRNFGEDVCFLCGCELTGGNRTREHVIPLWAQQRFKLLDQRIILLNGTEIPYRQLTVPCCFECNNIHLKPIEDEMSEAVLIGPKAVESIGQNKLFIWLSKIFYGLLYKELFLQYERNNPQTNDTITDPEMLMEFQMLHYFLQSARTHMEFREFFPASIMVFETQQPLEPQLQWDFHDSLQYMFISCRMGNVGILASLMDGGANSYMSHHLDYVKGLKLHPLQFRELVGMVHYKATLFNRTPKYMIVEGDPIQVIQNPLGGFSTKPIFNDWESETYAHILSQFTGAPLEIIYNPPNHVMTWLRKADGSLNHMPFEQYPWPR